MKNEKNPLNEQKMFSEMNLEEKEEVLAKFISDKINVYGDKCSINS